MSNWFNPQKKLSRYKAIFTQRPQQVPSNKVVDGPIIGNGDVGVVVSGEPEQQRFWISKNDFWKAKRMFPNGSPCLLGGIDIHIPSLKNGSYYCEQRLYEAEIRSTFQSGTSSVSTRSWVAASQNLLVIELSCEGEPVPVSVDLWVQPGHESTTVGGQRDGISWVSRHFSGADLDWPTQGSLALRSLDKTGNEFVLHEGEHKIIVISVCTNHDSVDCLNEAIRYAEGSSIASIASIRAEHDQWWRQFWSKSAIEIGDELLEQFWYGSHYIMACCSRNKAFPPGLFGNWITTDSPAWAGDYHMNYNYQAPWWGTYSSNHIELTEPYDTPILQYVPIGQQYAAQYLGCRGVYYDVGIGPKGLPTALCETPYEDGHMFCGQRSNASYCAINMLMRFYHTYDRDYAEQIAYPFLLQVGKFWEDYLKWENDRYVIYNDAINEVEVWTTDHEDENWAEGFHSMNPLLSLGFIRAIFKGLIDISTELSKDGERRAKWSHILSHISEFPTYEREGKTVFRLTERGSQFNMSNSLEIQQVFPAGAIGLGSDPGLLEIARNTLTAMNRWSDYNGFSTIFTAAARVGYDPDVILAQLRRQCVEHSFPNLFIFFGGGGIECCSGVPTAINEMLLQSHEQIIRLFPVWPVGRNARFENLRAVGAFLVSSELIEGEIAYADIKSEKGRVCKVVNPWKGKSIGVIEMDHDLQHEIPFSDNEQMISFQTVAGKTYKLIPRDKGVAARQ